MRANKKFNTKDYIGKKFNKWTVISYSHSKRYTYSYTSYVRYYFNCVCDCGKKGINSHFNLYANLTKSCRQCAYIKHGLSFTPEYAAWINMIERCYNPKNCNYHNYGARNITVCKRWQGKKGLHRFLKDMGLRPTDKHSIDRINNDGNYEPKNCRWTTRDVQQNNRRPRKVA